MTSRALTLKFLRGFRYNKDFDMTSPALLEVERRRRNNENGINRKRDKMLQEERMRKIITELSREMIA